MSAVAAPRKAPPSRNVDPGRPVLADAAIAWLHGTDIVHSFMGNGGCDMGRADVEERIRAVEGYGLFVAHPDSFAAAVGHHLAVWNPGTAVGSPDDGYWLHFETTSATPP